MKWLYRLGSLCAVCTVTLSLLVVPAAASDVAASTMAYDWNRGGTHITGVFDLPRYDTAYVAKKVVGSMTAGTAYYTSIDSFALDEEQMYSGSVAMYVSYYFNTDVTTDGSWTSQTGAQYQGYYTNDIGSQGSTSVDIDYFTPVSGTNPSNGYRMTAHFMGTDGLPISAIGIKRSNGVAQAYFKPNVDISASTGSTKQFYLNVPSATVVGTATSGELSALEGIADSIAAQSEILNAMYGDIVSICNSIYQRTGDLLAAQNLTNQYFAQIIPILNAIQTNTGATATNTSNIYSLLASQFALLVSTIQSESFDIQEVLKGESEAIQDSIDDAVSRLIQFLTTVFDAPNDLGQVEGSAENAIINIENSESSYANAVFDSWDSLPVPDFSGGIEDGFAGFLNLFGSIWDALAPLHSVFYFSWTLGIVLVIVGRKARTDD